MISFGNPSWLYGLLGLLIPIGIHLLSRKEGKTIYIGSIRHLSDSDTAQFSSIRLNEVLLLLLRMLLITILVFLLAGFRFETKEDLSKKWLLIEKGIERNKAYVPMVDSLKSNGFEIRWFSDNFPTLGDSSSIGRAYNYSRLIHLLPSFLDTAIVMTYSYASSFKGEKSSLPGNVLWLTVEPSPTNIAIAAVKSGSDSVAVRVLTSKSSGSEFSDRVITKDAFNSFPKTDSMKIDKPDTINISIYASESFSYDSKIIRAVLDALANRTPHLLNVASQNNSTEIPANTDFLFWLSDEQAPKTKVSIGHSGCQNVSLPLLVSRERAGKFCPDSNLDWVITQHITEENALNESLTYTLANIILPTVDSKSFAPLDHRTFSAESVFSASETNENHGSKKKETKGANEPMLGVLLFILLITERIIAYNRKQ